MGIVVIVISSSDNDKLSSPLNFFLFRTIYAGSENANIMKWWRKVGNGLSKFLKTLITVALRLRGTKSANALAYLISFMS